MTAQRLTAESCMEQATTATYTADKAMYAQMATAEALIELTRQVAELAHALRTQR